MVGLLYDLTPSRFALTCDWLAQCDAMHVLVAAVRFRRDRGEWPDGISSLVPDYLDQVPIDRFVDRPMVYRHSREAIEIYSLGLDQTDDGGHIILNQEDYAKGRSISNGKDYGVRVPLSEIARSGSIDDACSDKKPSETISN